MSTRRRRHGEAGQAPCRLGTAPLRARCAGGLPFSLRPRHGEAALLAEVARQGKRLATTRLATTRLATPDRLCLTGRRSLAQIGRRAVFPQLSRPLPQRVLPAARISATPSQRGESGARSSPAVPDAASCPRRA